MLVYRKGVFPWGASAGGVGSPPVDLCCLLRSATALENAAVGAVSEEDSITLFDMVRTGVRFRPALRGRAESV